MLLRSIPLAVVFAAFAAAPASADIQLQPLKDCYVAAQEGETEGILVQGTGFTPLTPVSFYLDDVLQDIRTEEGTPVETTFEGKLRGTVPAPFVEEGERSFTLRVVEDETLNAVEVHSRVTRLSVEQRPSQARTRERVRFRGRGFTDLTTPVYAHYVFAGKSRKTVRLGMPTGECGRFSVKRRQFPFKNSPRRGLWTIQFDQSKTYDAQAPVRYALNIRVRKAIKPRQARAR